MASGQLRDCPALSRSLPTNCRASRPSASSATRNKPGASLVDGSGLRLPSIQRSLSVDLTGAELPLQVPAHRLSSSGSWSDPISDALAESVLRACRDTRSWGRPL